MKLSIVGNAIAHWCIDRFGALAMVVLLVFCPYATAEKSTAASKAERSEDISIIGNTELPKVNFNLPWKLPSIVKRSEAKPVTELSGMLVPIEPEWHDKQVFFSQYLELELPSYSK